MKHYAWLAVVGLVVAQPVWANGFRNPPASAEALGRDGGRLAATAGPSSAAINPAALVEVGAPSAEAGLVVLHSEASYSGPAGASETTDPWKPLPNLHGAVPAKELGLVFGCSVTAPYGQSTEWERDSVFAYTAPYRAELTVVDVNPAVAMRLCDQVAVGAGLDVYESSLEISSQIPWSAALGVPGLPDGDLTFDGEGSGVGWNVGVLVELTKRQRVAVTYRSPVEVSYDGDTEVGGIPVPGAAAEESDFSTEIEFPAVAALGYGVDVTDALQVGVDVEWIGFSSYDALDLDAGANAALLASPSIPQDWEDTWTFGAGGRYVLGGGWVVRAGYKFLETPVPDETLAPTLPDADTHLLSAGVGYSSGRHAFDAAYAYAIYDDRAISGNANPAFDGTYSLETHFAAVSYRLSF